MAHINMHGIESVPALALTSEDARPLWVHHSLPWIELRYSMAATRLRRTFQYPTDDDDIPKDLDEEGDYT